MICCWHDIIQYWLEEFGRNSSFKSFDQFTTSLTVECSVFPVWFFLLEFAGFVKQCSKHEQWLSDERSCAMRCNLRGERTLYKFLQGKILTFGGVAVHRIYTFLSGIPRVEDNTPTLLSTRVPWVFPRTYLLLVNKSVGALSSTAHVAFHQVVTLPPQTSFQTFSQT